MATWEEPGGSDPGIAGDTGSTVNLGLGDLWEKATGAFSLWMDVEKYQFDKALAVDQLNWQRSIAASQAPVGGSLLPSTVNLSWILPLAVLIGGGFLVYRMSK